VKSAYSILKAINVIKSEFRKNLTLLLLFLIGFSARGQTTLIHRYSFITNANDEVGTANGTVEGGATFNGSALVLNGTNGYVLLPAGVVSSLTAVTVETWASFGAIANNSFLFGFGNTDSGGSGEDYIFCTPHGSGTRAAISAVDPGYDGEQEAVNSSTLDKQSNVMVATVFNPPAHFIGLYLNGSLVASNTAETDAMSVVNDAHSYIGRSLYNADPYLNGAISEFRIFSGAPTNNQIAVDASAGPGQIVNYQVVSNPGTLNSIAILGPSTVPINSTAQLAVVGDYQNVTNAYLFEYGQPTLSSGNTVVLTVNSNGLITPLAPGQAYITVQYSPRLTRALVTVPPPTNYTFTTFGEAFWAVTNAANGQVLTLNANGASQEAYTNGGFDQQFALLYNYQNSTFRILQHSDWECIGAANGGTTIGTGVTPVNYSGQSSQQWYLVSVGNGLYRIVNAGSDYVLQTDNGNPANVTLQAPGTSAAQLWGFSYQTHYPKKGTAGYEGPPYQGEFQTAWAYNYNDNTSATEPSNFDFVPMVDTEDWEPISDLQSRDPGWLEQPLPACLLGYNEPDNPSNASTAPTTNQAAANWPSLMALDVPLVAPAMQNEEDTWETCFYDLMAANGYRVDYAACHLYVPPNTSSFISNIQSEYNAHGLPVWVTEFSPVDWDDCQCWSEDDDYNFLAEFMWEAESLNWIERYAVFPFSNTNPDNPWVANGFTGSVFMSDGQTLSPYGELYATWDGVTYLQTNTPYLIHNPGTSFRLTTTNNSSTPVSQDIYVRNASAQWALIPAPTTNYYIISLNDGRRLCNKGGRPGLAAPGTTNSTCQWWMNGPNSLGYYYIDNLSASQSIEATGSPPAISFGMINDPAPSSATEWRLIKPYQPVAIGTPVPPSVAASYTSQAATLTWSGNGSFYNVYRSTTSGGPYTQIASYVTNSPYLDNTLQNGRTYYYVVTSLNLLGQESAYSPQVVAYPASTAPPLIGVNSVNNGGQNGLQLNWAADHTGWRLLINTNGLLKPNWVAVPISMLTNQIWMPFSCAQPVFFQLVYP
jgi:hypothetical protein